MTTRANKKNKIALYDNNRQNEVVGELDTVLTSYLLNKNLGDLCYQMENASNVRTFVACSLIVSSIQEMDIGLMNTIIKRVDGTIPTSANRDSYANLIGNAIDVVMDLPPGERADIQFDEPVIVSMAKAIVLCALEKPGKNPAKRKDRNMAADILFSRTGGLKTEPVKTAENITIEEPEWARELQEGSN